MDKTEKANFTPETLNAVIATYRTQVRNQITPFCRDASDADVLEWRVWEEVWLNSHQYAGRGSLGGWIRSVCHSVCLQACRRRSVQLVSLDAAAEIAGGTESEPEAISRAIAWENAITLCSTLVERLPTRQQAVLRDYLEGKSLKDTAIRLGRSVGTIKALRNQAKASLRALLGAAGQEVKSDAGFDGSLNLFELESSNSDE